MLDVQSLTMKFGGLVAVNEVDIKVGDDDIIGLIGPNGAGKTTLFNCISGIYKPTSGHISFENNGHPYNISEAMPHTIVKRGMARTFQNVRLFKEMTVLENVLVGYHSRMKSGFFQTVFQRERFRQEEEMAVKRAYEMLDYFKLNRLANTTVKELPFGRQKVLEIARALISSPKLLLLDEPAAGLNSSETEELMDVIKKIKDEFQLAILLIEHDMKFVMSLCERIYVMDHGVLIAEDIPEKIQQNTQVITAYLGEIEL